MNLSTTIQLAQIDYPAIIGLAVTLLVVTGLLLSPYLLGPLLIKMIFWAKVSPTVEVYNPYQIPPPVDVSQFFNYVAQELQQVGFEPTSHMILPEVVANVDSLVMFLQNPQQQDEAIAMAAITRGSDITGQRMQSKSIEFSSTFQDGLSIDTNNSQEEHALALSPHKQMFQFQKIFDPVRLYHVHRQLVAEHAKAAKQPITPRGMEGPRLAEAMAAEFAYQVNAGIFKLDASRTKYRATLIGAFKMTWKNLFPIKQLYRSLRNKKCDEMLRRWNI
jgi:hypothetical protein